MKKRLATICGAALVLVPTGAGGIIHAGVADGVLYSSASLAPQPKVMRAKVNKANVGRGNGPLYITGPMGRQVYIKNSPKGHKLVRVVAPVRATSLPGGGKLIKKIDPITPYGYEQLNLRVLREKRGAVNQATGLARIHYLVVIPYRPNGLRGWVTSDYVAEASTPYSIRVNLRTRQTTLSSNGRAVRTWRVVIGKSSTPTPRGQFAVYGRSTLRGQRTTGDGILVFAYSNVLQQFDGGNGKVAFHGNPNAALGSAASHGCVRMSNEAIRYLLRVPIGTPVDVV